MSDSAPPDFPTGAASERGVMTALRYSLMLVIVAILVSGLFVGVGELVENQQERAIGSQLETVGNRLATDLGTASRLVETGRAGTTDPTVKLTTQVPDTVAGSEYRVTVAGSEPTYTLTLWSFDPVVETTVTARVPAGVKGSVSGGRVQIRYDATEDRLVMRDV